MKANQITSISSRNRFIFLLIIASLSVSNFLVSAQNTNTNQSANTTTNANASTNANANVNTNASGNASPTPNNNPVPVATPTPCPSAADFDKVKVSRAFKQTVEGKQETTVQLEDVITVEVEGLDVLLAKAQCANPTKKILLFLDGRPVKGATPYPPADPGKNLLMFELKRSEEAREVWTYILGESKWTPRPTKLSVGLEDEYAVNSLATISLIVIPQGWFFFWAAVFILLLIAFWLLAVKTDLLRDTTPEPVGTNERKPYSLARTQAAWWCFLVLASYLFIGMITGDFGTTINSTVLGLLGISAGTVVGSAFVDAGKDVPPPQPNPVPYVPKNKYWWVDILSDANGVSFHRFQIAAWTFVLGIIFLIQVYKVLAMPAFNGSLLALLGISAGTYLGLKIPEPTTPTTPATPQSDTSGKPTP